MKKRPTPKELVTGLKNNNERIMEVLYTDNYPKIETYVLKNSGSKMAAKDVYQEAFIATWKNVREEKFTIQNDTSLDAYLCQIARNKWKDVLRSRAYKNSLHSKDIDQLQLVHEEEETPDVDDRSPKIAMKAIEQLGEQCRLLLQQFYFERKSMKEIAQHLKLDAASTRNKKYRCMQQLRKLAQKIEMNHG